MHPKMEREKAPESKALGFRGFPNRGGMKTFGWAGMVGIQQGTWLDSLVMDNGLEEVQPASRSELSSLPFLGWIRWRAGPGLPRIWKAGVRHVLCSGN